MTSDNMREMNAKVERDKEEPADVAAEFLKEQGI
jgi:osmoprotectant transport system substrate-binding protein